MNNDNETTERTAPNVAVTNGTPASRIANRLAGKLRHAADRLSLPREVDGSSTELSRLGLQTRAWIEDVADQIEQIDPARIKDEIVARVQRQPGTSLLIAAAAGLLLGVIVRRR